MRFCHSVWSAPMDYDRWDIKNQLYHNIWMFALSVALVKKAGHTVVLHTDSTGKDLFGFLPYDEVFTTLDSFQCNAHFWAAGKLQAQKAEPMGSIHIDGDVFLLKPAIFEYLSGGGYRVLTQNLEDFSVLPDLVEIYDNVFKVLDPCRSVFPEGFMENRVSYNCGVVGFKDKGLKEDYISGYESFVEACSTNSTVVAALSSGFSLTPDLVLEQAWLGFLTELRGSRVKWLPYSTLKDLGLTHFIGRQKYYSHLFIKATLLSVNRDLFHKVNQFLIDKGLQLYPTTFN